MRFCILVGGIIASKGKVLLLKRVMSKRFLPGFYDLPGGKVELGEDPNLAIVREAKEETGIDVSVVRPYNVWSYVQEKIDEHCIEIDFVLAAKQVSPIKLSPTEHSEHGWFGKDELPENLSPELGATILKYFDISPHP